MAAAPYLDETDWVSDAADLVRSVFTALQGGDYATALSAYADDVEWDGRNLPDGKLGRGHAAIIDHTAKWSAQWSDWTVQLEDADEVAPGIVVAYIRERGTSDSGVEMDERHAEAYLVRDGKIVRRVGFSDPAEACRAVADW